MTDTYMLTPESLYVALVAVLLWGGYLGWALTRWRDARAHHATLRARQQRGTPLRTMLAFGTEVARPEGSPGVVLHMGLRDCPVCDEPMRAFVTMGAHRNPVCFRCADDIAAVRTSRSR